MSGKAGRTGTPGLRVFLTWLRPIGFLRGAVLKLGHVGRSRLLSSLLFPFPVSILLPTFEEWFMEMNKDLCKN
jgi:hypothetical protein